MARVPGVCGSRPIHGRPWPGGANRTRFRRGLRSFVARGRKPYAARVSLVVVCGPGVPDVRGLQQGPAVVCGPVARTGTSLGRNSESFVARWRERYGQCDGESAPGSAPGNRQVGVQSSQLAWSEESGGSWLALPTVCRPVKRQVIPPRCDAAVRFGCLRLRRAGDGLGVLEEVGFGVPYLV